MPKIVLPLKVTQVSLKNPHTNNQSSPLTEQPWHPAGSASMMEPISTASLQCVIVPAGAILASRTFRALLSMPSESQPNHPSKFIDP
jgi:hypothetical protein